MITVLDSAGDLAEADQRAVVRFVIQDGYGADVVFAAGTTGEWDRVPNAVRQRTIQVCAEEVAKINAEFGLGDRNLDRGRSIEAWAGVTAHTARETLENLEFALEHGAHAAVLAPLSIEGIEDPVRFVARDVADLLDRRFPRIPVYLYDNADIAVHPKQPHIRTRQVKAMSRLDFVRGIKVSAPRRVLGNYTKAVANFRKPSEFGIYVGHAMLIFDLFRPRGAIAEHWNRYRLRGGLPTGVVSGPANALPREWARAWQVCHAGDFQRMKQVRSVLEGFQACCNQAGGKRTIACLKRALQSMGVISSASVAPGTPELEGSTAEHFDGAFAEIRAEASKQIGAPWVSDFPARGNTEIGVRV